MPELVAAATELAGGRRRILGIAGAPGAGKSVFAAALVAALGSRAALVGMDGFHLSNAELDRSGRRERKGAPDTFDVAAYLTLLRRLRTGDAEIWAPRFDRSLEEPIVDAVRVPADVALVVTEGNYLLLDAGPWAGVREQLDECWFVEVDEADRLDRLMARHRAYGRTADQARDRAYGSDLRNAELIAATRARADRIVTPPPLPGSARR